MSPGLSQFLRQFVSDQRLARFASVVRHRSRYLTLVLENIHHAHNASACLRTSDCFGIQNVHIIESLNSFKPNEEIALGSNQWLTMHRYQSRPENAAHPEMATAECFQHLRNAGYRILATSPRQDSVSFEDVRLDAKTAIVFGAEQLGVSDYAIAESDQLIHIPMFGFTESFNISVSAALILQQLTRQMRQSTNWELSDEEQAELLDLWVRQSLGSKLAPLCRRFAADNQ